MLKLGFALLASAAMAPGANAAEWLYFDEPVKVEATWYDELGEGNLSTGLTITDALDKYDILCLVDTEFDQPLPGVYVRWSDSFVRDISGTPSEILADERGNGWTDLQWAEACQRLGMIR